MHVQYNQAHFTRGCILKRVAGDQVWCEFCPAGFPAAMSGYPAVPVAAQPAYTSTYTLVQPSVVVVGGCPACRWGTRHPRKPHLNIAPVAVVKQSNFIMLINEVKNRNKPDVVLLNSVVSVSALLSSCSPVTAYLLLPYATCIMWWLDERNSIVNVICHGVHVLY